MEINNFTYLISGYPVSIATNLNGNTPQATTTALFDPVIKMEAIKLKSTNKPLTTQYSYKTTKRKPTRYTTRTTTYYPVTMETPVTMASPPPPSSDVWVLDLTWDDATWLVNKKIK